MSQTCWWKIEIFSNNFDYWDQIKTHRLSCCDKSDGLSLDEQRAVASAQIAVLRRASSGRQLKLKKKINQDRILTHSRF